MIDLKIFDEVVSVKKDITLYELSLKYKDKFKYPILAGYVNNELCDLSKKIVIPSTITFIDCSSRVGSRIYQKALAFIISYAAKDLYGIDKGIRICHSIDKGIRVRTDFSIDDSILDNIMKKMQEIVSSSLKFEKCLVNKKEAIKYFLSINDNTKVSSLKYITNHYINLYKLGDIYDYFYSVMPYDTSSIDRFKLHYLNSNEFVLQFPSISNNLEIPDYVDRPLILGAFNDIYKLSKKLNIYNVCDINSAIASSKINDIIKLCEVVSNNNLLNLAQEIYNRKDSIKIVLIAGPSSSGKTTTARKLSMFLKSFGLNPKPLSIDDYFLERIETPKLPTGEYDFESVDAIDLDLFNQQLTSLLAGEEVKVPTYNFYTGSKEYNGKSIKLDGNDILVIEGLHGLNEKLTSSIPKENKFKVYVSPLTDLNIDDHIMISTSDVRLLRRIVRDNRSRGYVASQTIAKWGDVRSGEEKYVFPFQNEADFVFNSALTYEVGVLKLYAEPLLFQIDQDSLYYEEARRLINFLSMFLCIAPDAIPEDSIIREFIGKSYFEEGK